DGADDPAGLLDPTDGADDPASLLDPTDGADDPAGLLDPTDGADDPAGLLDPTDGAGDPEAGVPAGPGRYAWLTALPLAVLLAGASWGAVAERAVTGGAEGLSSAEFSELPLPWQGDRLSRHALDLSRAGEHELAARTIQEATRWSPDVRGYHAVTQMVLYRAGAISSQTLLARIEEIGPGFGTINLVAEALIDQRDLALARALTEDLLATYDDFEAQGLDAVRAETWYLRAELEAVGGDCEEARAQIDRAVDRGDVPEAFVAREFGPLVLTCPGIVEGVSVQNDAA
ncbi:MAG TPA: hypothetical protein VGA69_04345, partial [Nitriliruptorales bacterium]